MQYALEAPTYIDVGYGCPITLSTSKPGSALLLLPAQNPGSCSFQTDQQDHPWMTVDLGVVREVKRIRVFNHEGVSDRAIPLLVSASRDGDTWRTIALTAFDFGGQASDTPLEFRFRERIGMRYLKLEVQRSSSLHLDYVELSVAVPGGRFGRYLNLKVLPDTISADYYHHESYGFAWTFTCALGAIFVARSWGIQVRRLDFSRALAQFKDQPTDDPYPDLFETAPELIAELPHAPHFERHGNYVTFALATLRRYVDAYFAPSRPVRDLADAWTREYGLVLDRTVVLVYRGTDKDIEVKPAPIEAYVNAARHLRALEPGLRVAIQTDQAEALDYVLTELPDAIHLRELPVTTGKTVIHRLPLNDRFGITPAELAKRLLAMIHLYSGARYVVSHTGNIGAWLALYRGRADGFFQFDEHGALRDPSGEILALASD